MSETVRQRRRFLRERVTGLRREIDASEHLTTQVETILARLEAGDDLPATPSDAECDLLLSKERQAVLPAYYLKLRAELALIEGEGQEARKAGRISEFLDGPVPKTAALTAALVKIAEFAATHGDHVLRALGLGYHEQSDTLTDNGDLL